MRTNSERILAAVYTVSMILAFTTRYGDYSVGRNFQLAIGACWIAFALFCYVFKLHKNMLKRDLWFFVKLYFLPHVIIHLYTIVLMIAGVVDKKYFSTNVSVYIPTLLAITSVYFFGKKALRYNIIACVSSFVLSVSYSLIFIGINIIPDAIRQAYFDAPARNYLELHDLVLAVGYIIIFYAYTGAGFKKRNFLLYLSVVMIMLLGMKRIVVLGILAALAFMLVIKKADTRKKYKICIAAGVCGIFLCYLYVYANIDSTFFDFLQLHSINSKGRAGFYRAIMRLAEFKVTFLGIGRNAVTKILTGDLSYMHVGGVHSDLIKMYVENGFIMYGLWLWYYLVGITQILKKRFGYRSAVLYFLLTIVMFALYATDNTENYFICQIISIILPTVYAVSGGDTDFVKRKYGRRLVRI